MKHFDIGIFVENKYLLKELNAFQLVAVYPTRFISLGGQLNRFGNSYYSKYDLELDFSKHLSSMADLAIGFNYTSTQIKSSNTLGVLSGNVSMLFNTSEITMGFCIKNIHSFPLNNGNKIEQLSEYTAGIGYQASDNFFLNLVCFKSENEPINYVTSFQYQWSKKVFFKMGYMAETHVVFGGLAFLWNHYRLDFSTSFHQNLGISPGFGISTNNTFMENRSKFFVDDE